MTDDELGAVLRRLRAASGLTQEELAARARVSARTVSDIERGLRTLVHRDTARRLASALALGDHDRTRFEALARRAGPVPAPPVLPAPPTGLVGRERELAEVTSRLADPAVRLLTLTGAGGIGKTRLALEAAARVAPHFGDGVCFVPLGELTDAALVASELAKTIGVVETGPDLTGRLVGHLAGRRTLIVLDTFEHLVPAVPLVYALTRGCARTTFLVTSRSALRLRGEREFPVPPLAVPPGGGAVTPGEVTRWPATALFWQRARAVRPDLVLDAETAALVAAICRKLDGLPLAVELAAARVKHLPLAAIPAQLEHRLHLLVGGPRDVPGRQRAIRDTVAWSHDLLAPRERTLLRRVSVFAGGWDLDATAPVTGCGPAEALPAVSALVDQSLVALVPGRREPRYDMLDVVREYAADRLADAGETAGVRRRHALHYLAVAESAEPHLVRTGHEEWFRRLDTDRGNLRRGMAWAVEAGETEPALRYTVALWRYWRQLGEFAEGRRWAEAALAVPGPSPPSLRAKALCAASALAFPQGDHGRMAELAAEALDLAHRSDDPLDLRNVLTIKGMVAMWRGDYARALPPYTRSVEICRGLGTSWQLATSHLNLGTALLHTGRIDDAARAFEEALRVYRELGDDVFAARVLNHVAHAALARDDLARADRLARQALAGAVEQGERQGMAEALETLAALAARRDQGERAAELAGAATTIRDAIAARAAPFDSAITGPIIDAARRRTDPATWSRAWTRGRDSGDDLARAREEATSPAGQVRPST
ncbi:ATP-binding protein [Amycolatopsis thermophila]|uniref:ATPase/DNA-binding XRE family transcriptional regulator n=1 Tax=Amycolatopsis thermophila TaxID=206084 RepID=A0ABU0F153_9PSEU|nr:helix-turn-helix domain-containing protein [Amycolatopsis thermophila]MDQ0381299.1 putative ATPase/DNA-binding XRE family transcriptional regulator [Amycolatopsis thermophila]